MLLYMMLYIMLAYLMLFAALCNAVCLHNAFFAIDFCYALSWFIDTWFVYFRCDLPSCAVLLICWFFLIICSHIFFNERAMCSQEK